MTAPIQYASVRYLVDDVQAAVDFYTTHLGFTVHTSAAPDQPAKQDEREPEIPGGVVESARVSFPP